MSVTGGTVGAGNSCLSGLNVAKQVERTGQIPSSISQLASAVEELHCMLDTLQSKLYGALNENVMCERASKPEEAKKNTADFAPLAGAIMSSTRDIKIANERIEILIEALEV